MFLLVESYRAHANASRRPWLRCWTTFNAIAGVSGGRLTAFASATSFGVRLPAFAFGLALVFAPAFGFGAAFAPANHFGWRLATCCRASLFPFALMASANERRRP